MVIEETSRAMRAIVDTKDVDQEHLERAECFLACLTYLMQLIRRHMPPRDQSTKLIVGLVREYFATDLSFFICAVGFLLRPVFSQEARLDDTLAGVSRCPEGLPSAER